MAAVNVASSSSPIPAMGIGYQCVQQLIKLQREQVVHRCKHSRVKVNVCQSWREHLYTTTNGRWRGSPASLLLRSFTLLTNGIFTLGSTCVGLAVVRQWAKTCCGPVCKLLPRSSEHSQPHRCWQDAPVSKRSKAKHKMDVHTCSRVWARGNNEWDHRRQNVW